MQWNCTFWCLPFISAFLHHKHGDVYGKQRWKALCFGPKCRYEAVVQRTKSLLLGVTQGRTEGAPKWSKRKLNLKTQKPNSSRGGEPLFQQELLRNWTHTQGEQRVCVCVCVCVCETLKRDPNHQDLTGTVLEKPRWSSRSGASRKRGGLQMTHGPNCLSKNNKAFIRGEQKALQNGGKQKNHNQNQEKSKTQLLKGTLHCWASRNPTCLLLREGGDLGIQRTNSHEWQNPQPQETPLLCCGLVPPCRCSNKHYQHTGAAASYRPSD